MGHYVALLRGINVGGKNLIKMADLKTCFEEQGFQEVATYIASGNVLFGSGERSTTKLTDGIELALTAAFDYRATVVVKSRTQLRGIVKGAPKGFGGQPDRYRSDVLFLKPPLTAAAAFREVPIKEGVDQARAGKGVIYFARLTAKASQSRLSRVASMPIYQEMTIRSWSTTVKLLERLDAR